MRPVISWLGVAAGVIWVAAGPVMAREPARPLLLRSAKVQPPTLETIPASYRQRVQQVIDQPNLTYSGKAEEFDGNPSFYLWLLDHPDRAAQAWRRLGTPCMEIVDRGQGRFGYSDQHGSDLWWDAVYVTGDQRVWYAEGRIRPALWLPPVPLRAVVVFRHSHEMGDDGLAHLRHQADIWAQTDSRTAALVLRLLGPSVPSLSEQCASQMGLFYSGLVRFFARYPERADELLFGRNQYDWLKTPLPEN